MESDEYITNISDTPNPDSINLTAIDEFFSNTQFKAKDINHMTDTELEYNIHQLYKPNDNILPQSKPNDYYELEQKYIPQQTNPYKVLLSLKADLLTVKNEIDQSVQCYNNTSVIDGIESSPYSYTSLDHIISSKKTVDAFIDYNLLNAKQTETEAEYDIDIESDAGPLPIDTTSNDNSNKLYSTYERYTRLKNNLISQLKQLDNDLHFDSSIDNNKPNGNAKATYEIIMKKVSEIEQMNSTILQLEERLSYIETALGNWEPNKNYDTVSRYLMNLVYYNDELTENSDYKMRLEALKTIDGILAEFNTQYKGGIASAILYSQVKEYYYTYETSMKFKSVFGYMQARLRMIKEICDMMEHLPQSLYMLNERIENNEREYLRLVDNFNETIKEFKVLEGILKKVNEIDKEIETKVNQ